MLSPSLATVPRRGEHDIRQVRSLRWNHGSVRRIKDLHPEGTVTSSPGALFRRAGGASPSRKKAFSRLGVWSGPGLCSNGCASSAVRTMMSRVVASARIVPSRRPRSRMRWSAWWTLDLAARVSAAVGMGPPCRGRTSWSAWLMTRVQERAQRGEAGLVEVLGIFRALKHEVEGVQRQGFEQGFTVRVASVEGADADPGVRCDGPHRDLAALAQDRRHRRGEHAFPVGLRITAHAALLAAARGRVVFHGHRPIMAPPQPPANHDAAAGRSGRSRCRSAG